MAVVSAGSTATCLVAGAQLWSFDRRLSAAAKKLRLTP